jgi:hypothetical protein
MSRREIDAQNERILLAVLIGAMVVLSLPAVLVGFALNLRPSRRRAWTAVAALAGLGLTMLLWGPISAQMSAAVTAFRESGGIMEPGSSYGAAWPHVRSWWLLALGLAPAYAWILDLI